MSDNRSKHSLMKCVSAFKLGGKMWTDLLMLTYIWQKIGEPYFKITFRSPVEQCNINGSGTKKNENPRLYIIFLSLR